MQTENQIIVLSERTPLDSRFNFLAMKTEEPLWARLYKVMRASIRQTENDSCSSGHSDSEPCLEIESDAYTDVAFLKQGTVAPFPVRLGREITETVRAIRQNPVTFISLIAKRKPSSLEDKRRMKAGVAVAILVYAVALSAIYVAYAITHRRNSSAEEPHLKITRLQLPPMPVTKTTPVLKQPGGPSKNQLTVPAPPPEPHQTAPMKSAPPRALDQTQAPPAPQTQIAAVASEPNSPVEAKALTLPAASGGSGPETGNGTGHGSGTGQERVASAQVDYNNVFSISNVTTRPQILGRPTPGYTEEARRAQIEGAVKLAAVLDANGAVSEIRVVRGLGYGLDERAIEAARQLRFVPAQKDGHRVSVRVFLEFKFTLL